ncbi:GNAT family N-acetyltransferase [Novosphingobium sp. Leaf2]|uniref:GNAT family N-acetyltransferase n=1 Tax=Novosphingobium sp. Leaf2 TaxID=1735670 RepID=UPI0009EC5243|nr:GNAT family N-acetyltransferase [Novosphingobium sp. Leaf2]
MAIVYHLDLKEVQSDAALAALLSDAQQHAPFDRLAWWQGLAAHCRMDPMLAVSRTPGGIAVLPLAGRSGHLTALANWYTFRFRPIVTDPHALRLLARDLAGRAHRITLHGLPDEDASASTLEAAFRAAGWLVRRSVCDTNRILAVAGRSYDDYLTARPGKLRTTLKRKSGKVVTRILTRFDADAWAQYEAIYAESWKPEEGSPDFLRAFARAEGDAGRLRLALAQDGADPKGPAIAAQMWTVEGGTAFIHKLAHREAAKPLSPGSVLTAALMRHVIETDGVDLVDFGTGDDPYKRDWMEGERARYRLDMFRPRNPRNWPVLARMAARYLAAHAKRG